MTVKVKHVSFTLTKQEIKSLNRYRKDFPNEDQFEFKITPTAIGEVTEIRPRDREDIPWSNVTDYECW